MIMYFFGASITINYFIFNLHFLIRFVLSNFNSTLLISLIQYPCLYCFINSLKVDLLIYHYFVLEFIFLKNINLLFFKVNV